MKVADAFLGTAWAMKPDVLESAARIIARHDQGITLDKAEVSVAIESGGRTGGRSVERAQSDAGDVGYTVHGSVAVIPVGGTIHKYASSVGGVSAGRGTSVERLRRALSHARASGAKAAMLMVDSPGGSVAGVETFAQDVQDAVRGGFPVYAYADDLMASAAYWIGSQAVKIYANPTAAVGSIGVYTMLYDSSEAWKEAGYQVHLIKAGEHKGIGANGIPVTEEQLARVQEEIDAYYEAFVAAVHRGRGAKLSKAQVRDLADGRVHIGKPAVDLGLVDGLASAEKVLAAIEREHGGRGSRGSSTKAKGHRMDDDLKTTDAPPAATVPADGGGMITRAEADRMAREAAAQAATEAIARVRNADGQRNQEIQAAARGFAHIDGVQDILAAALGDATVTVDQFRSQLLDKVAAASKPAGQVAVGASGAERRMDCIEAMLLDQQMPSVGASLRAGGERAARMTDALGLASAAEFGVRVREARSGGLAQYGLRDIARMLTDCTGVMSDDDLRARAFGSHGRSDFPALLENLANKSLLAAFAEDATTYDQWCHIGSSRDFKESSMVTMSELGDLLEVPEGDTPKQTTLKERAERIALSTFGRRIALTRQLWVNDDLGAFLRLPQMIGYAAARVPESLAFIALTQGLSQPMSDGVNFFHASRGNLLSGAALSEASLRAAYTAMSLQRGFGPDAAEIDIRPEILLVPAELKFTAETLLRSQVKVGGTNGEPNPVQGLVRPISSSRLSRYSATGWYMLANPTLHPVVQVNFLNGSRVPQIARLTNGSILSMEWEVIFDCGAARVQPEAATYNAGA